eukprot:GDKJ01042188.1.p1 GENE.GDKJ01042188.1~~GDKJ01042188.1.p1  ORF type:complete len:618 (+),score=131.48 GDKJ01042188.1:11-1864(+)
MIPRVRYGGLPTFCLRSFSSTISTKQARETSQRLEAQNVVKNHRNTQLSRLKKMDDIVLNKDANVKYDPREVEEAWSEAKTKAHKKLWILAKRKSWHSWHKALEELRNCGAPLDEVSYSLMIHLTLLSPDSKKERVWDILTEMKEAHVHPSLIRLNHRLCAMWFELDSIKCTPEEEDWRKMLRFAWFAAFFVRGRRQRAIARRNQYLHETHGIEWNDLPSVHSLEALWSMGIDPLMDKELQEKFLGLNSGVLHKDDKLLYKIPELLEEHLRSEEASKYFARDSQRDSTKLDMFSNNQGEYTNRNEIGQVKMIRGVPIEETMGALRTLVRDEENASNFDIRAIRRREARERREALEEAKVQAENIEKEKTEAATRKMEGVESKSKSSEGDYHDEWMKRKLEEDVQIASKFDEYEDHHHGLSFQVKMLSQLRKLEELKKKEKEMSSEKAARYSSPKNRKFNDEVSQQENELENENRGSVIGELLKIEKEKARRRGQSELERLAQHSPILKEKIIKMTKTLEEVEKRHRINESVSHEQTLLKKTQNTSSSSSSFSIKSPFQDLGVKGTLDALDQELDQVKKIEREETDYVQMNGWFVKKGSTKYKKGEFWGDGGRRNRQY